MNIRQLAATYIIASISFTGVLNGQPGHSISVTVDGAPQQTPRLANNVEPRQIVREGLVPTNGAR